MKAFRHESPKTVKSGALVKELPEGVERSRRDSFMCFLSVRKSNQLA